MSTADLTADKGTYLARCRRSALASAMHTPRGPACLWLVVPMPADASDRDARVDLVAAALCDAEWSHRSVWQLATEVWRDIYRREAQHLLVKLDTCATAHHTDLVTDLDIEAGLRAILHSDDDGKPRDWSG